jgi:transporter family protein
MATWILYALAGAVAAAMISVLGKKGMEGVDSNVATAVRSVVQAAFVVGVVTVLGAWEGMRTVHSKAFGLIVLTGVCGGLSWLFMFKALSLAPVSKVGPLDKLSMPLGIVLAVVLLGERPGWVNWVGIVMMSVGAYLAAWSGK